MDKGFGIDYFGSKGCHVGGFYRASYLQASAWAKQSEMSLDKRLELAGVIIAGKLKNQLNLIKYFHKYHKGKYVALGQVYSEVSVMFKDLLVQ